MEQVEFYCPKVGPLFLAFWLVYEKGINKEQLSGPESPFVGLNNLKFAWLNPVTFVE